MFSATLLRLLALGCVIRLSLQFLSLGKFGHHNPSSSPNCRLTKTWAKRRTYSLFVPPPSGSTQDPISSIADLILSGLNHSTEIAVPIGEYSGYNDPGADIRIFLNIKGEMPPPSLISATNYEIAVDPSSLQTLLPMYAANLRRLITHGLKGPPPPSSPSSFLFFGLNTFFTSLTAPSFATYPPDIWPKLSSTSDALEVRVDLFDKTDRWSVLHEVQMIRFAASGVDGKFMRGISDVDLPKAVPIVYTVRSCGQAGTWPNSKDGIAEMFELLELGLRSGSEVLDIEANWDQSLVTDLCSKAIDNKYNTFLMGSYHAVDGIPTPEESEAFAEMCTLGDRAHCAKLVLSNVDPSLAKQSCEKAIGGRIPYCAIVLKDEGKSSRLMNERFTPVTHEDLPFKAAPGQMPTLEIMSGRISEGLVKPKTFGILGHNIDYSVSPQMHNAAFECVGLPYVFERYDYETVEEFLDVKKDFFVRSKNDSNFFGASVTIPHKQNIIPHLDVLGPEATAIGAVNTIVVEETEGKDRVYRGENTDWIGIRNPVAKRMEKLGYDDERRRKRNIALICGGGGTARAAAYAAKNLNFDLIWWNRTTKKVEELANTFGGRVVESLEGDELTEQDLNDVRLVISTLPAAASFKLPDIFFSFGDRPIVLDVNYKPYHTPLLTQAVEHGCEVIRGSEMLWGQGIAQFEFWTKRNAPHAVFKDTVLDNCE